MADSTYQITVTCDKEGEDFSLTFPVSSAVSVNAALSGLADGLLEEAYDQLVLAR